MNGTIFGIIVAVSFFGILFLSASIVMRKEDKLKERFDAFFVVREVLYNDGIEGFIQSEKCHILLREEEILFHNMESNKNARLKYSKITACGVYTDKQISKNAVTKNGNVIGRGALGGLLLGPVGAMIGGMSGINSKTKTETTTTETYYLIINYKKTKSGPTKSISFKTTNFYKESDLRNLIEKIKPNIDEKLEIEL